MSSLEALYIFDEHNTLIFTHIYTGRPPAPSILLPLYLQHPAPRPSILHVSSLSPPAVLFSILHDSLLFLSPCAADVEPLLVFEFLHRLADSLEEFLGSPLLATKVTSNYDVVVQVVSELADAGVPCQTEPNALRDVVETGPGVLKNLLGGVGLPGSSPAFAAPQGATLQRPLQPVQTPQGSAVPWRRSNVRHTSNEMYVDVIESLAVTLAPSGRPLAAYAHGSIAFNSQVSGVPDVLLNLSPNKSSGVGNRGDQLRRVMERVVFHPCVRLHRWKNDGVLSFVPPDGRFALCGYEVDLLGPDASLSANSPRSNQLSLPAMLEVSTGLGHGGNEFEVVVLHPATSISSARSAAAASLQSNLGRPGNSRIGSGGDAKAPPLENLAVHVPLPTAVRNVTDLRPSKGEAHFNPAEGGVEWRIAGKDFGSGRAVLRCTVQGPPSDDDNEDGRAALNGMSAATYEYADEQHSANQIAQKEDDTAATNGAAPKNEKPMERNQELMPNSATLSFSVKGWLASGLKVDSLLLNTKASRGLGPEVKPYKGVKYVTVSKKGVELRC